MRKLINILVSLALLGGGLYYVGFDALAYHAKQIQPGNFLLAILFALIQSLVVAGRWHLILKLTPTALRPLRTLRAQFLAMYASLFIPSIISGTAIKVSMMKREGISIKKSLASVAVDKVLALLTLLVLAGIGLPTTLFKAFPYEQIIANLSLIGGVLAVLFMGATALAYVLRQRILRTMELFARILHANVRKLFLIVLLSFMGAILGVAPFWVLLDFSQGFLNLMLVVPTIMFFAALPISIGGWGVREGSGIALLALLSVPAEQALLVAVQVGLAGMAVSMIGAFMWPKNLNAAKAKAEIAAEEQAAK